MQKIILILIAILLFPLAACKKNQGDTVVESKSAKTTQVSVVTADLKKLTLSEETVGTIESVINPTVAAEISARVTKLFIRPGQQVKKGETIAILDASDFNMQRQEALTEVARIGALLANQEKIVERNRALVDKNFISRNALDDATTELTALKQQLAGAKNRVATISHSGAKNRVVAPTEGIIESQVVAEGDFVRVGDPIAQIVSKKQLRAHLPFPEALAEKLKPGLTVKLTTPTSSTEVVSVIREIKPQITANNRTIEAIVDIEGETNWQPGASVNGRILLGERTSAILVPEQSVVLRPAGDVVYEILNDIAHQRVVKVGLQQNGMIEVVDGLRGGEIIAMDGAAFLTDQTKVSVLENK